jgi:hypothetical protein
LEEVEERMGGRGNLNIKKIEEAFEVMEKSFGNIMP